MGVLRNHIANQIEQKWEFNYFKKKKAGIIILLTISTFIVNNLNMI